MIIFTHLDYGIGNKKALSGITEKDFSICFYKAY